MADQDPMAKSIDDYADLLAKVSNPDSPVGIDARLTHAIIIDYLQQITARLDALEKRVEAVAGPPSESST